MTVFKVKKSNDGHGLLLDIKATDLFGVLHTIGSAVPVEELEADSGYIVRISADGLIEIGYQEDHWTLK